MMFKQHFSSYETDICLMQMQNFCAPLAWTIFLIQYAIHCVSLARDGIADLHCRSDLYIIDELKLEFKQKGMQSNDIQGACSVNRDL